MKSGKSIMELATQLQDIRENSRDFIVPTEKMAITLDDVIKETESRPAPVLTFTNGETKKYSLNNWSDGQMATYADIPRGYYDRIKTENPALFAENVNHGLRRQADQGGRGNKPEGRMVRTYGGQVRALVSPSYRRLDCVDLLETVFPALIDNGFEVKSCEITDRRMYLQATTPRITADVKVGDAVQFMLTISGSDVGAGAARVEPGLLRLWCLNGMTMATALRKFHIGRDQGSDSIYELLTDQTKELSDAAFWSQVRDVVLGSMQPEIFNKEVDRMRVAANEPIKNFDIPRVVELAANAVKVSNPAIQQSMVAYLANGADGAGLTKWGLANAFTYAANSESINYDDAVELQRAGARIIDLTPKQWSIIAAAPAV